MYNSRVRVKKSELSGGRKEMERAEMAIKKFVSDFYY